MGLDKLQRPILVTTPGSDIAGVPLDFSTSEQETDRKWTDGKTVYQKTIPITVWPDNSSAANAHGITGIDNVLQATGWVRTETGGARWGTLPRAAIAADLTQMVDVFVNAVSVWLRSGDDYTGTGLNASAGAVTLLYTKT